MKRKIRLKVNGTPVEAEVEPRTLLVYFLREILDLTGTHVGCDTTTCGACTVLLDGVNVKSCTVLALTAHGREVTTIEGLARDGKLHPMQEAFAEHQALQCGYCTPGMILSSVAFLKKNPKPTREEIRRGISGNLCRCTGYIHIVDAVEKAAKTMSQSEARS